MVSFRPTVVLIGVCLIYSGLRDTLAWLGL